MSEEEKVTKGTPGDEEEEEEDIKRLEEEKRERKEAVKKKKEEMRRKAEERRKKEKNIPKDEEDEGELVEINKSKKPSLREDLVSSSVNFLNHPKVRPSPLSQKMAFLQKKGLTQEEIQEAINRSNNYSSQTPTNSIAVYPQGGQGLPVIPPNYPSPQVVYPVPVQPAPWYNSKLGLFALVISCVGAGIGFTLLGKAYMSNIGKYNRTEKKNLQKEKVVEEEKSSDEIINTVKEIQVQQSEMREMFKSFLNNQQSQGSITNYSKQLTSAEQAQKIEIAELKAELKKLKAMLLDNKSTHSITQSTPNPTIMGWSPSSEAKLPSWMEKDTGKNPLSFDDPYSQMLEKAQTRGNVGDGTTTTSLEEEPRPKEFGRVLQMVQNGQIPDDIKPINDRPLDPNSKIERGQRTAPQKPWTKRNNPAETTITDPNYHDSSKVQEITVKADGESKGEQQAQ